MKGEQNMKKLPSILTAVLLAGCAVFPASAADLRTGDADHSGTVDAADASALCDWLLCKGGTVYADTSDTDGNGHLNAKDLALLKRQLLMPPAPDPDYMSKIRISHISPERQDTTKTPMSGCRPDMTRISSIPCSMSTTDTAAMNTP